MWRGNKMMAPRQTTGRLWLVSGLAVLFSSITAWATPIYSRMEFWLRGPLLRLSRIAASGAYSISSELAHEYHIPIQRGIVPRDIVP